MLPEINKMTYEEFLRLDAQTEERLEFIAGLIYNQASPGTDHQRILTNLSTAFGIYFRNKTCKHVVSPYDIVLQNEHEINRVQPDLSVICDATGYTKNNYVGTPTLVVEILSPSTASRDFIQKMDLYMRFGVKEYWIVSPINQQIQVFILKNNAYDEPINFVSNQTLSSSIFPDLTIPLSEIF